MSQTQFQYRLIRTLDEIIELIEADNGFNVFVLDGQTCLIQDYLAVRPERAPVVRRLIRGGRLVIGPWYSMPDVFLADGESLIRNLARGYADCLEYGAPYPNVGYVPDSFGHIEQMPQLLRRVGIDNYIFSRGRPVALAMAAGHRQEFMWRAPDGSTIFAWHQPEAYGNARYLPGDPDALRERFRQIIATHRHSHRPDIVLAAHGMDHTWLQRDIADILRRLPTIMPDVTFHHGTIEDALREWKRAMPADMETWDGPLRGHLEINALHGTLSSRMDNKLANARARHYLENLAEPLDAVAGRYGKPSGIWHFRKAWEWMLQNHAHDSICGCSQDRVHDAVNARFLRVSELGTDLADAALDYLNQDVRRRGIPGLIVYAGLNGGHAVVEFVVRMAARPPADLCLADADGTRWPVQVKRIERLRIVHTNAEVHAVEVRGYAYLPGLQAAEIRRLTVARGPAAPPIDPVRCAGRCLENGRLRVDVAANGTLTLTDPRSGRCLAGTHYFVQETDLGGGYHFEPLAGGVRRDTRSGVARIRCLEKGPLRGRLEIKLRLPVPLRYDRARRRCVGRGVIAVTSVLSLDAGSDRLEIATRIDNPAGNQRLRLVLPTAWRTPRIHADASFAVHVNAADRWPSDPCQNFHPMRSFVDISDEHGGLAFLGRGQHEYAIVPHPAGTDLEITLLRSVDFVFLCSTWETPGAQLRGVTEHAYAMCLHTGDWRQGGVAGHAAAFVNPPVATVHGDSLHPHEHQDHATLGFYARRRGVEAPVDTNRSPWHAVNAHRDGWRRMEPDRFLDVVVPHRIVPFRIDGRQLVVSAFKRADDGHGEILRFWSAAVDRQPVRIHGADPDAILTPSDLLERPLTDPATGRGMITLDVRPFEIVTVRMES